MSHAAPILVIDDDANECRAIARALNDEGFGVVCASSAARAFELLGHTSPGLVLVALDGASGPTFASDAVADGWVDPYHIVLVSDRAGACGSAARWSLPLPVDMDLVRDVARELCPLRAAPANEVAQPALEPAFA